MSVSALEPQTSSIPEAVAQVQQRLLALHGEPQRARIERGLSQVAAFWRPEDGDAQVFEDFALANFAANQPALDTLFLRFERLLEQLDGHMHEIVREFRTQLDLDLGDVLPYDETFAGYDPSAHVLDDFFDNKLAFTALLNFPLTTLEERLLHGKDWSRRQWAEARLAQRFSKRVPAEVNLAIARAAAETERYVTSYNIWMHHLLTADGQRLFPPGLFLISHWNLRDTIKALYAEYARGESAREAALTKQRMIQQVMRRIVTQTIPRAVVNSPHVDWDPFTNRLTPAAVHDGESPAPADLQVSDAPEPDTRYAMLLKTFHAIRKVDPYSPTAPTHIARRFDEDRELPEARVQAMLEQVVTSPLVGKVARLIETRLGRPLEPFDLWYSGFRPGSEHSDEDLTRTVSARYPTPKAFEDDVPRLLAQLGFSAERAREIASHVAVDPGRGAGHAMGAEMRSEKAHLRTRIEKGGMNYKGFNVAAHELGHNVEQVISITAIDYTLLRGVPNTAFTEAFAFIFQEHDLELLGLPAPDARSEAMKTLNAFWGTYEIAGVSLLDMAVWHWMYDHPQASPAELRQAVLATAEDLWNRYYAPVFRTPGVPLLAVYSHMIDAFMYLPDYPIGHLIAFQVEAQMKQAGNIGSEFERMAKMGRVSPDLWMENATGKPVGAEALLAAAEQALHAVESA